VDLAHDRGCLIFRNVVPEEQAVAWERAIKDYIRNHQVRGLPAHNPSMYSLWWTPAQVQIRSDERIMKAMDCVSKLWHVSDSSLPIDLTSQVVYADRLRIRRPSKDAEWTLPAHLDSGSIERWEDPANRSNFQAIFDGDWDKWDGWSADRRYNASSDLYDNGNACSCWRSLQGWLSLSHTATGEGTLRILPSLKASTAYYMLRPLFYDNEIFNDTQPTFPGATPGKTQFKPTKELHPHLLMEKSIVGIPPVKPGDYVFWHCDLIHEVDRFHPGTTDSSVVYNACAPLTPYNIENMINQRNAFQEGVVPKDFSESKLDQQEHEHAGCGAKEGFVSSDAGRRAMGLMTFDESEGNLTEGQRKVRRMANEMLGHV
jgi:hypothetical protein